MSETALADRVRGCLFGAFIADALAMPVHYYYETDKLRRDYGRVEEYVAPKNPHADSFMGEATYKAPNPRGEILHDQAKYWGQDGIHYHQLLQPGENTLNLQLARGVWDGLREDIDYDVDLQVERYIKFMTTPGRHRDTYIDGCHQHFFTQYANGRQPLHCGHEDRHIGGLAALVPIVAHFHDNPEAARVATRQHLYLTHLGEPVRQAATFLVNLLLGLFAGCAIDEVLYGELEANPLLQHPLAGWLEESDEAVVGGRFKTSCYVEHAIPCVAWLALKYANDPREGLVANTNLGGDNCYRGAVLGAILGASQGMNAWPESWVRGLVSPPAI
jgi:ADP-ribosylglycohydrolase